MSAPTSADRLRGIQAKTERAKQHIADLERAVRAFRDSKPYEIGTERDPKTGYLIYQVVRADEAPLQLSLIAGDAIQNLRTALDHLAHQLVLANGNMPTNQTYFPICKSAEEYKAQSPRKVKGMSQAAIDLINAANPYLGGNDLLWAIHSLNNIDKHNLLLVVGTAHRQTTIDVPVMSDILEKLTGGLLERSSMNLSFPITDPLCPLKAGDKLHALPAGPEQDVYIEFSFDVAFGEPEIVKGKPLLETVQEFAHLVDGIVSQFVRAKLL
jgi:hypothetical protein